MKILLFTSYDDGLGTPKMRKIMKKYGGIRGRVGEIIEYVENHKVMFEDSLENSMRMAQDMFENNKETIVTFSNHSRYYYNSGYGYMNSFEIVEVDTIRPWTIKEYDGAEYIKYLDEQKLVDKELNYWKDCNHV